MVVILILKLLEKTLEIEKKETQRTYLNMWTFFQKTDFSFLNTFFSLFQNMAV